MGAGDGSVIKSAHCLTEDLSSAVISDGSRPHTPPLPRNSVFSDLQGHLIHVVHINSCRLTYTHKIYTFVAFVDVRTCV